jgi:hypothetical protein
MKTIFKRIIPSAIKKSISKHLQNLLRTGNENHLKNIPISVLRPEHITNLKPLIDRLELLKHLPENSIIAEIGVNKGDYSQQILSICQPRKLHLIDAWASKRYNEKLFINVNTRFLKEINSGKIEIHRGFSTIVGASFPDDYFDWVYIDTDHSYNTTKEELEIYSKKVKKQGIISGHDFSAGNWRKGIKYGVIEAVYEFCVKYNWELIFLTTEIEAPSFAIRKR